MSDDEALNAWVGRQVNLKRRGHKLMIMTEELNFETYKLDDPAFEAELAALACVRVKLPGEHHTADYKAGRVNVVIDKLGVITDITNG